jgi:multicomponent Na+:H+ antiporter subunit A
VLHILAILSPFIFMPAAGWLGGRGVKYARLLSLLPAALTGYFVYWSRSIGNGGPQTIEFSWVPSLDLSLSFHLDGLALFFATLITGIGTLIVLYSSEYIGNRPEAGRFQISLFAFMGSMLGLVLSDNLFALFVFWELTGFTSYLLIGFDHERAQARSAALQALLVTGGGGLALLAAAVLIHDAGGTASLAALGDGASLRGHALYGPITALVLLAAFTKSAQFPFHFWLPNAMEAPTPVSAYLHSATMVKAGVYLVARTTPILGGSTLWMAVITTAGLVTMAGGAYRAVTETDLKRILAYSTISALGALMLLLGMGTAASVAACLTYLLAHACYKGALFLVAGVVERMAGTRDVTGLGGLRAAMPWTAAAGILAAGSMAGIPLFFGFVAKEQLYESVMTAGLFDVSPMPIVVAVAASSALLGASALIAGVSPFVGRRRGSPRTQESPALLWLPPLMLASLGLTVGIAPALAERSLASAAASVVNTPVALDLRLWHGVTTALLLSIVTLAATGALYAARDTIRRYAWPRTLATERLYAGALRFLDFVSGAAGPALQSASLRSYVLTTVVAAVVLVGAGLATGQVLPALARWTPMQFHELAVGVLIVAAAVSAAFARSNMAAVLSLGTVGYGVALVFVLFGAPDLAMTQFAVETLTVVIFVLVFHQLRGFGDLSPALVKARDAAIALAAGTLVAVLVLFIGTSGTTSRLAAYFAETAPRLAHGRNIVNVILVDFRALDTLGEVTVLVTVAVGVRALLRIGRERHP